MYKIYKFELKVIGEQTIKVPTVFNQSTDILSVQVQHGVLCVKNYSKKAYYSKPKRNAKNLLTIVGHILTKIVDYSDLFVFYVL